MDHFIFDLAIARFHANVNAHDNCPLPRQGSQRVIRPRFSTNLA
jgi:hypothetical protein